MNEPQKQHEIITFWFGDLSKDEIPDDIKKKWFLSTPEFDQTIKNKFGHLVEDALANKLAAWEETPQGSLALILLLDQFTRNIFRKTTQAFSGDLEALRICQQSRKRGFLDEMPWVCGSFFLMPYQHSEDIEIQREGVKAYQLLVTTAATEKQRTDGLNYLKYATEHKDIIEKFGRFPHRNRIFQRTSTQQELEYLEGASSYGQ